MRDFPHLRLGIRVSKAKSELASGLKVCGGGGMQKNNPRDYPKFWVGVTGFKNPIGDPQKEAQDSQW